ncbi:MAG: hypothetical protein HON32_08760 [Francisellaceae bacterium]|jgi:chemotaxis signal transduction protein|nr:hypothetical protein [Francisellaceae bacterium]
MDLKVLRKRADALAANNHIERDKQDGCKLMSVFLIGENSKFGIEIDKIQAVALNTFITEVPNTPGYILGVTYFQGEIITILNTAKFFNIKKVNKDFEYRVIIDTSGGKIAIMADEILDLQYLDAHLINPSETLIDKKYVEYTKGIHNGDTIILDATRIIKDEKLILENDND